MLMDKEMEKERNINMQEDQYMKENFLMEKEIEKEKKLIF